MPLHARFSPKPFPRQPLASSWQLDPLVPIIHHVKSSARSVSHSVRLLLYWVLPLAWRVPKVPHRPDFDGFIRRCPSIISSSIIHSFFHFPRPHHQPTPRACHQFLHLIIIPTPSLHHPSPLYTQPVNASSCHPFHLPCEPPTRNSITRIVMVLSCSRTHDSLGIGTGAHFSFSARPDTQQSVWGTGLHRELPSSGQIWCLVRW